MPFSPIPTNIGTTIITVIAVEDELPIDSSNSSSAYDDSIFGNCSDTT
jgi:hypothetical protein